MGWVEGVMRAREDPGRDIAGGNSERYAIAVGKIQCDQDCACFTTASSWFRLGT